ncbi:MAG: S8 family serine peptidase [Armatimonadota bacterium]
MRQHDQAAARPVRTPLYPAVTLHLFAIILALLVTATAQAAPRETVHLPYWPGHGGQVRTAAAGRPLVAAADRLLVGLPRTVAPQATRQRSVQIASTVRGTVTHILAGGRLAVVELPEGTDLLEAAGRLSRTGATFVEPDLVVETTRTPNDPRYDDQYYLPQINAPGAWDIRTRADDVVIAVVDSGVDLDHPDLADNIWTNPGEIPNNGKDDDGNGFVDDYYGWDFDSENNDPSPSPDGKDNNGDGEADEQVSHGTLVSGIAAAVGNNSFGTAGVAWSAKIMAVQVFPDDGSTYVSTVVKGIDYAVDNGADIINLSIGSSYDGGFSPPIERAYESGICVISAAGNGSDELTASSSTWVSPVCNDGPDPLSDNYVLGVAAVDQSDRVAWYTNFDNSGGNFVDVSAPGSAILGPAYHDPSVSGFSSYFYTNTGTSFACPMASGLAALILAKNPGFSPAQVYAAIRGSADDIDSLNPGYEGMMGTGRLNCGRALGQDLPPAPVTSFVAADTEGDDGGSITLTWTKSSDDGGGSNSVTGYIILRREGDSGQFEQIAELPAGTTTYEDTNVSDGTEYYYIVRTTDGSKHSDSSTEGPVTSKNDAPPPVVTDLSVADVPDDNGGSIQLDWSGYTPPADFAAYHVYRSERDFSSTSDMAPLKTITNPNTTRMVDATEDGTDYYYAVGVADVAGNENHSIRATGPVQSYPNNDITVGPGLLFMGPAAVPADRDPATLLNIPPEDLQLAKWDPTEEGYITYSPGSIPELLKLKLGQGFWVLLDRATTINPAGATAPAGDFSIDLTPGWHQLANPFFGPLDFAASTVTYQSNTMDLASAENAGIMRSFAWVYSAQLEDYELAYPDLGQNTSLIPPWTGFWVHALTPCTLTLARPTGVSGADTMAVKPQAVSTMTDVPWAGGWNTRIALHVEGVTETSNIIGTANESYSIPAPPPINKRPCIRLSGANADLDGSDYGVALGAKTDDSWTWNLKVDNLTRGARARVSLPDLSDLPNDYVAMLHDPAAGESRYLRTTSDYDFTAHTDSRTLQLVVQPRQAGGSLVISTLSVQQTAGSGMNIVFSLSHPCHTSVEVLNIAGRSVAAVEQDTLRLAGNHNILFDGRNSHGAALPSGRYLVKVQARSETGQQVQRLMAVNYNR